MKPTGKAVVEKMIGLVGTPYNELDCQAAIEEAVKRAGGSMNYRGSNDMARNVAWLGTLENAYATFGEPIPVGIALFINEEVSASTPEKYKSDGLGDFTHVGLYAGPKALKDKNKYGFTRNCDVVHSSASMGRVAGSTLSNGWTHAGIFKEYDCGVEIDEGLTLGVESEIAELAEEDESPSPQRTENAYGTVTSADGNPVKVREKPEKGAIYKYKADVGTRVQILGEKNGFYKIMYNGKARWMMKEFVELEE